jgi:CheY-like chemotaxis protein
MSIKKQILFVDDEARVLEGLRRMLRVMRNQWDMTFTNNGQEALQELETKPYDVIVCCMMSAN